MRDYDRVIQEDQREGALINLLEVFGVLGMGLNVASLYFESQALWILTGGVCFGCLVLFVEVMRLRASRNSRIKHLLKEGRLRQVDPK